MIEEARVVAEPIKLVRVLILKPSKKLLACSLADEAASEAVEACSLAVEAAVDAESDAEDAESEAA
ncbi:hypothetical protein HMPREF1861_01872 [Corynebacterium kroppenstedtii]|nr:hypothetical protein HMPREF1861_01872 [Corynebacterium kroppenstedtii]